MNSYYDNSSDTRVSAGDSSPTARPTVDAARLWSGGLATALVAGLIGLVGVIVVRVMFDIAAYAPRSAGALGDTTAVALCVGAALAALLATGLVQLLMIATPQPLAYFGWIVGLVTAAAVFLPLLAGLTAASVAEAVIHLVIGIAIGSLLSGSAAAAQLAAREASGTVRSGQVPPPVGV
ncbi:MAG TPA: DUF6069 family protein [Kribbella sp.]|uniref:DUF6069 family protein n=1 Tax=Kribbella sp. TaxID=1871183 RepID=UPI002D79C4D3|nr:DUF6069 family protein [Kribbella sp.]HET6293766.1 DUF6069 family protein [Kribbella sp.]